ncbi:hypothetical protein Mlute_02759 [Meiothermus luteus]|jgi:hypothetical protein|uniref:ABC-type transport auxiliary lipoprotein component domain-containing protein n=1 Tax=Meiothermus luteus TaxID=2026184 RepID=A0A399EA59_9DEIN|nr:hypothetical protein [Meiothermus luteus]RIH81584.1 hypothetical protein Mlute_02759 [Meiothermus luteus]RMH55228.1 MAG: hypothetical protein D6684_07970 [Deinococcota bacterium]
MRYGIVLLLLGLLLSGCAPAVRADPGEVVYDVSATLPSASAQALSAGHPVVVRLAQAVAAYYALEARPLPGYSRWVQRQGVGSTAVYVSQRINAQGQVEATVEMRWTFAVRADGLGSVRLETLASEMIDAALVEGPAFAWLDRNFRRVASGR